MAEWLETAPDFNDINGEWTKKEMMCFVLSRFDGDNVFFDAVSFSRLGEMKFIFKVGIASYYINAANPRLTGLDVFFFEQDKPQLRIWLNISEYAEDKDKIGIAFYLKNQWAPKAADESMICFFKKEELGDITLNLNFVSVENFKDIRCVLQVKGRLLQ